MKPISLNEFADRLAAVMPVMCKSMVQYEQNALTTGTLSLPQFWALSWLADHPGTTMHDLAIVLGMKASTATMLVDRLVDLKFLTRKRSEKDRRIVLVKLTAGGLRIITEIHDQKKKALRETFRPLSAVERQQYLALIETLAARLEDRG